MRAEKVPLAGRATPEGCARLVARRLAEDPTLVPTAYRPLGATGLTCSQIGFGGYRLVADDADHRAALAAAVAEGCNLFDTAANYGDGGSEGLIGAVISEAIGDGRLARDEVVIVTKAGYLQGGLLAQVRGHGDAAADSGGVAPLSDGCWHSLNPDHLALSLAASLDRLGVETVDRLLLHNPEAQLTHHLGSRPSETVADELYAAVEAAFAFCERQVAAGRIGGYGVSSNTLAAAVDDPSRLDLGRLLQAAEQAAAAVHGPGSRPRFDLIQLPYNLLEAEAASRANTVVDGDTVCVLAAAARLRIAVVTNRPLNAMPPSGGMIRLATADPEVERDPTIALEEALAGVAEAEAEIDALLAATDCEERFAGGNLLSLATDLPAALTEIQGASQWEQIARQVVLPNIQKMGRFLHRNLKGQAGWQEALDRYLKAVQALLPRVEEAVVARSLARNEALRERLATAIGPRGATMSLSQIALAFATSTPQVAAALCGMRQVAYVTDACALFAEEPLLDPLALAAYARG